MEAAKEVEKLMLSGSAEACARAVEWVQRGERAADLLLEGRVLGAARKGGLARGLCKALSEELLGKGKGEPSELLRDVLAAVNAKRAEQGSQLAAGAALVAVGLGADPTTVLFKDQSAIDFAAAKDGMLFRVLLAFMTRKTVQK